MDIDTRTIKNFLLNDEIQVLENHIVNSCTPWENWNPSSGVPGGKVMSGLYYVFDYYDPAHKIAKDILQPKFEKEFGPDLNIQQIHIFDAYDPYNIHSDVDSAGILPDGHTFAWTLIIPLFDVNSHTIVFNEGSKIKDPQDYIDSVKPFDKPSIDHETYKKYFSHSSYHNFHYFSIEEIFPWEKGALFAASRFKFHTSDNFLANGVTNKRAIIAWTSLPINS